MLTPVPGGPQVITFPFRGAAQAIANADLGAVQSGLAAYVGVPRAMAQLAAIPAYPLRPDARLLQRVADLMEQFNMTTEVFNVSSIIRG